MNLETLAPNPEARRQALLDAMTQLGEADIHCGGCEGVCCTFVANSMMTTPIETLDLYLYLKAENRITPDLVDTLKDCIRRYRLDAPPPGDGRRNFVRRTYTCPFFAGGTKGCTISRKAKPYGCLGFNPNRVSVTEGEDCGSDQALLQSREDTWQTEEDTSNTQIAQSLQLNWEKQPMPVALLELLEHFALTEPHPSSKSAT